jgi:hypothetical protein
VPHEPTTDPPSGDEVTAKIRGLASKWVEGLLLGVVTASMLFIVIPYSKVSSTIAIVLLIGTVVSVFWQAGNAGRPHARRVVLALAGVLVAFLVSAFGPFVTAPRGSYICLARPPGFGVTQSVPITVPLPSPKTVYVLGVDDPVRKKVYRWFFENTFREIASPRQLEGHVRLPLKHLHRRPERSEDRVSLYHPAPLVSRSIHVDTSLTFGAYTSVRPLISHTMRLSAGVPSWDDVAVSIKFLSRDELQYIVLLTEALDQIATGYGKEAFDILTRARHISPSADEQARIAVIQTFLAQQICAGNLGEIQSLYFAAIAIRATEDAGIIQRRVPYLRLSETGRQDQGEFVLPPETLSPLEQWIRTELRTHLEPFAEYAAYEPVWEGLALTSKATPGLGRISMPRPPDDCRAMFRSAIDDLADASPNGRQRVHSIFSDTFDQVAGLSPAEVADLVLASRNELDRLKRGHGGDTEIADAKFRLALLERAFIDRLTMAFACDFMIPVFHESHECHDTGTRLPFPLAG